MSLFSMASVLQLVYFLTFAQGSTRAPKRHVTSRDVMFYMEQERETRKSLSLYKTMLK